MELCFRLEKKKPVPLPHSPPAFSFQPASALRLCERAPALVALLVTAAAAALRLVLGSSSELVVAANPSPTQHQKPYHQL
jgi:hypothetical protein